MCVRVELMTAESGDLSGHPVFPLQIHFSFSLTHTTPFLALILGVYSVYNIALIYIRTLLVLMLGISQLMASIHVIYTLTLFRCTWADIG